jgi:zinc protease
MATSGAGAGVLWAAEATRVVSIVEDVALPPITRRTLRNGLRVVVAEVVGVPLVSLSLVIGAGAAQDPAGEDGLAALVGGALRRGTTRLDAPEFSAALDLLAGELTVEVGHEATTVRAEFLSRDARAGLDLVAEMVREPGFRRGEIAREREEMLAAIVARAEDQDAVASVCYAAFLYRGHPFGRPVDGRPSTLADLGRREVAHFHGQYYRANNAILAAVADLPAERLLDAIGGSFGGWTTGAPPPARVADPRALATRRILVVDDPGAAQAHVRIGNVAIARNDPQYLEAEVTNTAFGGGFTSRLLQALRVERSLTYSAWSAFVARRARGDFRIETSTKVATAGDTVRLVLDELDRLRAAPPDAKETARAAAYLRGQFPFRLESPGALARRLAELEWFGLGLDEIGRFRSRVGRVRPADLAGIIARAVPPADRVAVVVVGPAKDVVPALGGLGPVEVTTPADCVEPGD